MRLLAHGAEAGGHLIAGKLVTAAGAELVSGADGAEAVAAAGGELVVALGAEVEVALDVGAAGGALGDERGAEQEVEHGADAAGHDEADEHPEAGAHGAAGGVFADEADHEDIERGEQAPGEIEIDAQAEGRDVVLGPRKDDPEVVFDKNEDPCRYEDRPGRDKAGFVRGMSGLLIAHSVAEPGLRLKETLTTEVALVNGRQIRMGSCVGRELFLQGWVRSGGGAIRRAGPSRAGR